MTSATEPVDNPEVPVRLAASVLLLRSVGSGFEVFMQHRVSTMDFAAGMVVYPGGRVDAQDGQAVREGQFAEALLEAHSARWAHTSAGAAERDEALFRSGEVLAAARREVWEETGLRLDPAQLHPWANWVTPKGMPRRFDTYFFVAALDPDQEPQHQTTEAFVSKWTNPTALFAALERQEVKMMRPTQRTLIDAMELGSVPQILASTRDIIPVHPDPRSASTNLAPRDYELIAHDH